MYVEVQRCDRTKKECHDEEKIDEILARGFVSINFPMINVNPSSSYPLVKYSKAQFSGISYVYK